MERTIEYWGVSILFMLRKDGVVAALTLDIKDDKFVGNDFAVHSPKEGGYSDCVFLNGPCGIYCDKPFADRMANVIAESGTNVIWEKMEEILSVLSPEDFN